MSHYRPLDAVRTCWGLTEVLAAARLARLSGADNERAVWAARVLGARDIAQATVLPSRAGRHAADLGAVVDAIHVLSMLALAVVRPAWRRPALTSATVSTAFAITGVVRRRASRPPGEAARLGRPAGRSAQ